jgi:hypothetical protein
MHRPRSAGPFPRSRLQPPPHPDDQELHARGLRPYPNPHPRLGYYFLPSHPTHTFSKDHGPGPCQYPRPYQPHSCQPTYQHSYESPYFHSYQPQYQTYQQSYNPYQQYQQYQQYQPYQHAYQHSYQPYQAFQYQPAY